MQRSLFLCKTPLFHGKVISPISELYEDTKIIAFTRRELKKEIKKLNKKTSIDQDGISNRILKLIPDFMIELILVLFNKCLLYGKISKYWKQSPEIYAKVRFCLVISENVQKYPEKYGNLKKCVFFAIFNVFIIN